jgi:uncharacterized protein (DUF885 family)
MGRAMADTAPAEGDALFEAIAAAALEDVLERHPEEATLLGDHRFDDRLSDPRPEAIEDERRAVARFDADLATVDPAALSPGNRVDAEILRSWLRQRAFELDELREHEWNPMTGNPAGAIYPLLVREHAPPDVRFRAIAGRLAAIPGHLDAVRRSLGDLPRVHTETAIGQFAGATALLTGEFDRELDGAPQLRREIDAVRPAALEAVEEHRRWLTDRLASAARDPRIGAEMFGRKLGYTLDAGSDADAILARAEADLERTEEEIAEVASRVAGEVRSSPGLVRRVLDRLAQDHPSDDTVVASATEAFDQARAFTQAERIVTLYDDPLEIIEMPEFHRGVAVAYCDPPGPLETANLPTFYAISPTPADWPPERVASFYREYNANQIHDLTIHEGIPGHMLQLGHWRRFRAPTAVRAAFWSGPFVEGWAVYVERVMAEHGYRGDALRMQRLKMLLRTIINAILDARVHARGMTEEEGMRLMLERGHQEEGEAVGKWRRALLTSTQLSTYYVGYTEVSDLAARLRAARPELTELGLHDLMLSQGSPAPRHVRSLLLPGA